MWVMEKSVQVNPHAAAADSHSNKEKKTDRYSGKPTCNKSGQKHAFRSKHLYMMSYDTKLTFKGQ